MNYQEIAINFYNYEDYFDMNKSNNHCFYQVTWITFYFNHISLRTCVAQEKNLTSNLNLE